jgi:hypothetical protein
MDRLTLLVQYSGCAYDSAWWIGNPSDAYRDAADHRQAGWICERGDNITLMLLIVRTATEATWRS